MKTTNHEMKLQNVISKIPKPTFRLEAETTFSADEVTARIDARRRENLSGWKTLDAAFEELQAWFDSGKLHPTKGRYSDTKRRGFRGHLQTAFEISKQGGSTVDDILDGLTHEGFRKHPETNVPKTLLELPSYLQRAITAIRKREVDALELDVTAHEIIEAEEGLAFHRDVDAKTYTLFVLSAKL